MDYQEFLSSKQIIHPDAGIDIPKKKISRKLFPFQRDICRWALRKGRAAIFADCGLGKTPIQLEWAKHIPGRVLIFCPLAVAHQHVREGKKFGIDVVYSREPIDAKITVTNYQMLDRFKGHAHMYDGVVIDESSIVKSFEGKFRNEIIEWAQSVRYRLAATATPAPNDHQELGNHSEFLGNLSRTEMLATFFVHDGGDTAKWRLKKHATKEFWKWVCSFAVTLRKPSDLGYGDEGFILPELRIHEIVIDCDNKAIIEDDVKGQWSMFPRNAKTLGERRAARSQTVDERASMVSKLWHQKINEQWLIWCNLNKESQAVTKLIGGMEVTGSDSDEHKEKSMTEFAQGKLSAMVSKPLICGLGMNFQSCHNVVFLGLSDSYEAYYQAIRRCWRFGQKEPVDCYIVTSSLEGEVVKNIKRKESEANKMAEEMVSNMHELNKAEVRGRMLARDAYNPCQKMQLPTWI